MTSRTGRLPSSSWIPTTAWYEHLPLATVACESLSARAENLLPDSARLQKGALLTCPTSGADFEVYAPGYPGGAKGGRDSGILLPLLFLGDRAGAVGAPPYPRVSALL